MSKVKEILEEYQDIGKSLKAHSDLQIQTSVKDAEWMSHLTSLMGTQDMDILSELESTLKDE